MMVRKTFQATIYRDDTACFIPVPFDPKPVFGKIRAPVKVTLNGYTFRSTIASMGGQVCIPLRKSNREAAGLTGNESLNVTLELDSEKRSAALPHVLVEALDPADRKKWAKLSFTRQREYAEAINDAKKEETRKRRVQKIAAALRSMD
jgi:hypothetical protein